MVTNWIPLALVIPALIACVLLAAERWLPRPATGLLAIAGTGAAIGVEIALLKVNGSGRSITWLGGWHPTGSTQIGITLVADPMATGAGLTAAVLVLAAQVYGIRYFDEVPGHYPALMLLFLTGMTGFVFSGDLFDMFVFFELMGAAAYALTGLRIEDPKSVHGALNFGVMNSLGAYLTLMGVGLTYAHTGQLGLAPIGAYLDRHGPSALVTAGFALVVIGLLVKAALVPFHFWLADAHAVAPTPVCVLFSGIMVELGLYGVSRIYWSAFAGGIPAADFRRFLLVLGIVTALLGAVMCTIQRHLKRLLAYSTICHTGLFAIALATLDHDGTTGAVLYVIGHAAVKGALFLLVGLLLNAFGSVDEIDLFCRGRGARLVGVTFVLASLALAGLPPFGVGLGKAVSEEAAGHLSLWLPVVFVIGSAVTGGAILRASLRIFFGVGVQPTGSAEAGASSGDDEREEPTSLGRPALPMLLPIYALLAISLAIGMWPAIRGGASAAAARQIDHTGYLGAALHAGPGGSTTAAVSGWTLSGVLLGLLSAGLALALALTATHGPRFSGRTIGAAAGEWIKVVLRPLHRVHSGHLGDYVAWFVVGTAGVSGLLGLHP